MEEAGARTGVSAEGVSTSPGLLSDLVTVSYVYRKLYCSDCCCPE